MRKEAKIALLLFTSALVTRIFLIYTADIITPDGLIYIRVAKLIKDGNWAEVYNGSFYSFYPFVMIPFQKVFSDWETTGRIVSALFGSLTILPLYFLFRRMFDLKIAVVVCIFFILSPRIAHYSSDVLREPLFWFLSMTALWAGWKAASERKWYLVFVSSFFTGLALFTRIEGIGIVLIVCLWSGWLMLYREHSVKRFLLFLCLFFVSFPLIFSVPVLALKSKTGKWEMGHAISKIPEMIIKPKAPLKPTGTERPGEAGTYRENLIYRAAFSLWEAISTLFRSFHVVLVLLFIFGIMRRKIIPYSANEVPVLMWAGIFFIISVLYAFIELYVSTRHGLLTGIPALLWVSIGFFELTSRIERFVNAREWAARYGRHTMVYLLILICLIVLPKTLSSSSSDKTEIKKAGIYLKTTSYSGQAFAVQPRISRLAFYAEADYVNIPPIDYSSLPEFLREVGAAYLIVDEQTVDEEIKGFREHVGSLGLEKVNVPGFGQYRNYSFALYRVKK